MSDLSPVSYDFGYRYEPPCPVDLPGHRKLTVVMRAAASVRHFNPEKLSCCAATRPGEIEDLTVYHPWPLLTEYRVVAGRIVLVDQHGKKVEAFTFGGTLHVETGADQTTVVIESPAPILALLPENVFLSRVSAQAEALLARRRAVWDSNGQPDQFEARLAAADPEAVYQAVLHAMSQALSESSVFGGASDRSLERLIGAERVSGMVTPLDELL